MIDISNIDQGSNPAFSATSKSVHFRSNPRNTAKQYIYKQLAFRNSPK
jgi:hypothetical protein